MVKASFTLISLITLSVFLLVGCAKENVTEEIPEPVAEFDISNIHPAPCQVNFVNMSTGSTAVEWDFGDGNTSTESNPEHIYTAGGTYAVRLTISNANGAEAVTYKTISIPGAPSRVKITGIELNKVPATSPAGAPWDNGDDPDVFFYIMDDNGIPITMTGILENVNSSMLPAMIESGLPLEFAEFSGKIKFAAYDRDTGADAPDDFMGSHTINLSDLIPQYGQPYPEALNFNSSSNPLGFTVQLNWE